MITTLTLNPAFDLHVAIGEFRVGRENLASSVARDIGGKGINISRALSENSVENTALVVLGEENADEFRSGLRQEKLDFIELLCPGRIRENITIHPDSGDETRLSFKGFTCDDTLLSKVEALLGASSGDIVTFTGSLPGGVSSEAAEKLLTSLRERGVRVVIDSKSISLEAIRRIKPWLIKPNAEEIEVYLGKLDSDGLESAARELHEAGVENVMISLGADGALLVCEDGSFRAKPPKLDAVSTIGAGDSSIAGFIAATVAGKSAKESLTEAIAWGSAACLREGTNPPLADDIEKIKREVNLR